MEAATKCEQHSANFLFCYMIFNRGSRINRGVCESGIKQAISSCGEQDEKSGWEEDTTKKHLAAVKNKITEDKEQRKTEGGQLRFTLSLKSK